MKFFRVLILSVGLLVAQNTCPKGYSIEPVPAMAAVATWVVVARSVSLLVNTVPNPLWEVGSLLVGPQDLASRYALGGIFAGTVATCAALGVYKVLTSKVVKRQLVR